MMRQEDISYANKLLFERLSLLLNTKPDFITKDMVSELTEAYALKQEEAFSLLMCAALGFDTSLPRDRELWESYSPFMLHILDEKVFLNDPYCKTVRIEAAERIGEWELCESVLPPYSAFVCDDPLIMPDGRIIPQIGAFDTDYRFLSVMQNGREWMTLLPNEIVTQRVPVAKARGRVLTYGLGLGYFAFMCAAKEEVSSVTVVELDENVISLFKEKIYPFFPFKEKLRIINDDAFRYAEKVAPAERYDYIFADIWHDPSDGVPAYKRFKALEHLCPDSEFDYWVENTLKLYM